MEILEPVTAGSLSGLHIKTSQRKAFFTVLILLALSAPLLILPVYAPTNVTFIQTTAVANQASGTTLSTASFTDVTGDTIIVFVVGVGGFNSFAYSDSQSNSYSQKVASVTGNGAGVSTYIAAGTVGTGGIDTVTVATGGATRIYSIWAAEYRNVVSYGVTTTSQNDAVSNGATSYTSTLTFTNTGGSGSAIVETDGIFGGGGAVSITYNNGQSQRQFLNNGNTPCFTGQACQSDDYSVPATTFSVSNGWTWSTPCGAPPACFDSHSGLELVGGQQTPIVKIDQCYGNCGTPAVTLVNTNETHGINWNFSITLFYPFQPTITGFLLNVTTNLPKNYPSQFYAPFFGFYTAPNCPVGITPFTNQCPGNLLLNGQSSAFTKGKASILAGPNIPVSAGTWYAVAISFQIAPEDVNSTNTAVPIDVVGGVASMIPPAIGSSGVFNPNSHIGLWGWIRGNVVGSLPPPPSTTSCQQNPAGLDCILPNAVNGMCTIVTATCQTGGSLILIIILTFITISIFVYFMGQVVPNVNVGRIGIAEFGILAFLAWMMIFAGFNLVLPWVPFLIFLVVSWLFMGRLKGTGPI